MQVEKEVFLELSDVSKEYRELKAVNSLSLKVFKGDIYGFLGPNGAGKSTSIRMILSLIKPDSGSIRLFGKDLSKDRYQTLSRVGALIEKPDFYKYLSARKNLEILGKLSGVSELNDKIEDVLQLVGLSDRAGSKVRTYSQGMRQRLGIAQSLLHNPDLIILDEPGNGLDPQGQKEMRSLIQKLNQEQGITIILSSHILAEIEQIANRMIIINKGEKVVEGEVQDLLNGKELKLSLEVSNPEKTHALLQNSSIPDGDVEKIAEKLFFSMSRDKSQELINLLAKNEIELYSMVPMRNLEEYFISITGK